MLRRILLPIRIFVSTVSHGFWPPNLLLLRLKHRVWPQWITIQEHSYQDVQHAMANRLEPSGRLCGLLPFHRWRSFPHAIWVWGGTTISLIVLAWALATMLPEHLFPDSFSSHVQALFGIAAILGSLSAILFAIIVFSLQVYARRLDDAHFLVRYVARHEGLIPLAALVLAVVTANLVVGLLATVGVPEPAWVLVLLNVLFVPAMLFCVLWLLHRMLVAASGDVHHEGLLPVLLWEYARALDDADQIDRLKSQYHTVLSEMNTPHRLGFSTHAQGMSSVTYKLHAAGRVMDVDIAALRKLAELLHSIHPHADIRITPTIATEIDNGGAVVVSPSMDPGHGQQIEEPSEVDRRQIEELIRLAFRAGTQTRNELVDVLSLLGEGLVDAARNGNQLQLERLLAIHRRLVEHALVRPPVDRIADSLFNELPDAFNRWAFHRSARAIVDTGDGELLQTFTSHVTAMCDLALEHQNAKLLASVSGIYGTLYYRAITTATLDKEASRKIDRDLGTVFQHFAYWADRDLSSGNEADEQLARSMVSATLDLTRLAIDYERPSDAIRFSDHVLDPTSRIDDAIKDVRHDTPSPIATIFNFARIVIMGWCIRRIRLAENASQESAEPKSSDAAQAVAKKAVDVPRPLTQGTMVTLRESIPAFDEGAGVVHADHWTLTDDDVRPGRAKVRWGGARWITDGYIALLLALRDRRPRRREIQEPPAESPPDAKWVGEHCNRVVKSKVVREKVLGLMDDQVNQAITSVQELYRSRRVMNRRRELRRVVEGAIQLRVVDAVKNDLLRWLLESRPAWIRGSNADIGSSSSAIASFWPPLRAYGKMSKGDLLEDGDPDRLLWESYVELLRRQELLGVLATLDQHAPRANVIESHLGLAGAVREAIDHLREAGYSPSTVWLPQQERFGYALFGLPDWEYPECRREDHGHLGRWEGCDVYTFPYRETSSIIVCDVASCLCPNRLEADAERLSLQVSDSDSAAAQKALKQADDADDDAIIADPRSVTVDVRVAMEPFVALRNIEAARRIELDLSKLGYAMTQNGKRYHRAGCQFIKGSQTQHSLLPFIPPGETSPRQACDICKPDDWDDAPTAHMGDLNIADLDG